MERHLQRNAVIIMEEVFPGSRLKISLRLKEERLLKKYKYPPDKQATAVDLIIKQAEKMCELWTDHTDALQLDAETEHGQVTYSFQPDTSLTMVAEESVLYGDRR